MTFFANPRNFVECYGIANWILSLSGLFPYHYDEAKNKIQISWKYFTLTIIHISVYAYVNIASLMENWHNYAQPMIGNSSLISLGNLVLRLLGVIITFLILAPLLVGSPLYVASLNYYMKILDDLLLLGIDVKCIYRRIYYSSCFIALIIAATMIFTAWHSIYFYELITERPPDLKYYLVAFLSNYYKILFMCYGNMQMLTILLISKQMNSFLNDLVKENREKFEAERRLQYAWAIKNNFKY